MNKDKKHIINDYYIGKFDKLNYAIFQRKVNSKNGSERYETLKFYSRLSQLIKGVKELYVKEELFNQDVETLLNNLRLIEEEINNG